jgi:hypothetical protein
MYRILHNLDNEKITELEHDAAFVEFVERIAHENDDSDMFPEISINELDRAMDYLLNYCPNLTLL